MQPPARCAGRPCPGGRAGRRLGGGGGCLSRWQVGAQPSPAEPRGAAAATARPWLGRSGLWPGLQGAATLHAAGSGKEVGGEGPGPGWEGRLRWAPKVPETPAPAFLQPLALKWLVN